jgi:hypothetical protein
VQLAAAIQMIGGPPPIARALSSVPRVEQSNPKAAADPTQYFKKSLLVTFTDTPFSFQESIASLSGIYFLTRNDTHCRIYTLPSLIQDKTLRKILISLTFAITYVNIKRYSKVNTLIESAVKYLH